MRINWKDYLTYVRIFIAIFFVTMYVQVLPTLQSWSWGFWSYEYIVMCIFSFAYICWDCWVCNNRKLYRIETKLDVLVSDSEVGNER